MKRFFVFGGSLYYPRGGMWDFMESFDIEDEAKSFRLANKHYEHEYSWIQIWDMERNEEIV